MNIEESELKELLTKQKKAVESKRFPIEAIFTLVAFVLSALMAQIFAQKIWIIIPVWIFVAVNVIYVISLFLKYLKSKYSESDFIHDTKDSGRVRNFSLVVIKDRSGIQKDSYLLRYDRRWKCWLLPYRQTHDDDDKSAVLDYVKDTLGFNNAEVKDIQIDDIVKFSVSDQVTKAYHHTFYEIFVSLKDLSISKNKTIKINNEKFRWFTIDEMKRNKSIEKKNSETVNFIARKF